MGSEIHGLLYGFDAAFVAEEILEGILGRTIHIDCFVDSNTLFNLISKTAPILEKRLQIDVYAIRESHERGELRTLSWIPGKQNVADGLTKGLVSMEHPLRKLMTSNEISINAEGWASKMN